MGQAAVGAIIGGPVGIIAGALIGDRLMVTAATAIRSATRS
jgi:hypothetical protein